jgi:hypothetical protein
MLRHVLPDVARRYLIHGAAITGHADETRRETVTAAGYQSPANHFGEQLLAHELVPKLHIDAPVRPLFEVVSVAEAGGQLLAGNGHPAFTAPGTAPHSGHRAGVARRS